MLGAATHVANQALQWGQRAASGCGCGQKPVSQSKLLDHMATYKPAAPTSRQGTHQPRHPSRPRDQGTHQGICASLCIVRSQKFSWPRRQQCEWRHRHNAINPALWLALSALCPSLGAWGSKRSLVVPAVQIEYRVAWIETTRTAATRTRCAALIPGEHRRPWAREQRAERRVRESEIT